MRIGFAVTGSFCTLARAMAAMEAMAAAGHEVIPVFSEACAATDTRFGEAKAFLKRAEKACGQAVILTIRDAEPIGPKKLLDLMVIAPCTGATLCRLATGLTDSCVAMAAKAHLRNERPLLIALATNDGLSGSAVNIGRLLGRRNVYFVPFGQDDPAGKPCSLVARMEMIPEAAEEAMRGRQMQPVIV